METPDYFQSGFYRASAHQFTSEKRLLPSDLKQEPFVVEEFFDFSNDDDQNNVVMADVKPFDKVNGGGLDTAESSSVTAVDSCKSNSLGGAIGQRSLADGNFAGELCVPYDDLAELEWLSTFAEESFSSEDMKKLQLISGMTARTDEARSESDPTKPNSSSFHPEMPVPGKARSKRSRAAPGNWASRLQVLSPKTSSSEVEPFPTTGGKSLKVLAKKKEGSDHPSPSNDGRRCLHCQTDKTPQWRTGPMGPKTLCNACGVRYKSGRLVPEYRPAASPTFVLTKHSNSHRKVLELRRQKEMQRPHHPHQQHHLHHHHHPQHFLQQQHHHHHHQNMMFDVSNGGGEDYLIHQHMGPDYRQLI